MGDEFAEMLQLAQGLQLDPERPVFHVMSNKGWINVSMLHLHADSRQPAVISWVAIVGVHVLCVP